MRCSRPLRTAAADKEAIVPMKKTTWKSSSTDRQGRQLRPDVRPLERGDTQL